MKKSTQRHQDQHMVKHTITLIEIWEHQGKTSKGTGNLRPVFDTYLSFLIIFEFSIKFPSRKCTIIYGVYSFNFWKCLVAYTVFLYLIVHNNIKYHCVYKVTHNNNLKKNWRRVQGAWEHITWSLNFPLQKKGWSYMKILSTTRLSGILKQVLIIMNKSQCQIILWTFWYH